MMTTTTQEPRTPVVKRLLLLPSLYAGNAKSVMERGILATAKTNWLIVVSGFFEPVFYLLAMGIGLGGYIGAIEVPGGQSIPYAAYIAPALLAVAAMNGAVFDSTWNVFFKMNFGKIYDGMLATSLGPFDVALGEIMLALARGFVYACGFMIVMQVLGLNLAWSAILALPAVVLIAFAFASFGMGITSFMKTFQQMDWINFIMLPMFLLSATFYPITVFPVGLQWVIQAMPLWHGVELVRGFTTGMVDSATPWHILYFVVMILVGMTLTTRRLKVLFLN